jgi:hypothetical protein
VRWIRKPWNWVTLTPLRQLTGGGLALVVAAGLAVGIVTWINHGDPCPAGNYRGPAHECIGVSDGSYDFAANLHSVDQAILRENRSLSGPYVTVALLIPLTSPDPGMQTEILHAVQGAYIAQHLANQQANHKAPPIRLVLANSGVDSVQYLPVVQQLAGMTGPPDNLRAVAGISVSTKWTKAEVGWLAGQGIPVVGGAITADDLANTVTRSPYPGLARIEPTNAQEAAALAHYGKANAQQAVLVEDTRTDDDYISTLAQAFAVETAYQPYQYLSPPDITQVGDTANTFENAIVPGICGTKAKWIYFAGRQVQLRVFINALASGCQGRQFTILTGSSASHLENDPELNRAAFSRGTTLEYAAIASPDAWAAVPAGANGGSSADYRDFADAINGAAGTQPANIGDTALTDGQAIINYDAVLTAIDGIRTQTSTAIPMPSMQSVAKGWGLLSGVKTVRGASGWICLDNSGNPYDKAVPIVTYNAQGAPGFITRAWPDGGPPASPCQVPRNG